MKELVELTPSEMEVVSGGGLRDLTIVFAPTREREIKLTLVLIRNNGNTFPPP